MPRDRHRCCGAAALPFTIWVAAAFYVTACGGAPQPMESDGVGSVTSDIVTAAVASQLDAGGHFRLSRTPPDKSGEITAEAAERLGAAFLQQLGPMIRGTLEKDHGGAIDVKSVAVCGRTIYASSPYERVDPQVSATATGRVYDRIFGPWWLVTFCGKGKAQVALAVSSYATDLSIDQDGQLSMPPIGGEWFRWEGIPMAAAGEFPSSPEHAVQMAATMTGQRISTLPEFIAPSPLFGNPFHGRWRLGLNGPGVFRLTDNGAQRVAAQAYIGYPPGRSAVATAYLPSTDQPDGQAFKYQVNAVIGQPAGPAEYAPGFVRRRPEVPVKFVAVTRTSR